MTDVSSTSLFAPAVKEKLKARVAIDGPTGAGKTWTALQWARILVGPDGPIGVIDTENRSAAYYAPSRGQLMGLEPINRLNHWDAPYVFGHMPWNPPYDPIKLTGMIHHASNELGDDGCLIVDSFSHFWEGEGGTLDLVDNAGARSQGNRFAGWKEGTPAQRALLDAVIHARCHVICCMRSKMEYVLDVVEKGGRTTTAPRKVGMRPIQREGVEYEFTVIADMDLEHRLTITKSRCSLVADVVATKGHSAEPAQVFAAWLDSGVERITEEQAVALVDTMNMVTNGDDRKTLKEAFVATFGRPTEITTDRAQEVVSWVVERVHRMNGTTPPPPPSGDISDEPPASSSSEPATGDGDDGSAGEPATPADPSPNDDGPTAEGENVPRGTSDELPPDEDQEPADEDPAPVETMGDLIADLPVDPETGHPAVPDQPATPATRGRTRRSAPETGSDSAEPADGDVAPGADEASGTLL